MILSNKQFLELTQKVEALKEQLEFYRSQLDRANQNADTARASAIKAETNAHSDVALLGIEVDAKLENLNNLIKLYSKNLDAAFTPDALKEIRQKIFDGVQEEAKAFVDSITKQTITDNVVEILTDKVKKLVVENAEGKIDGEALSVFAEQVVSAILPQIVLPSASTSGQPFSTLPAGVKPFDPERELVHEQFEKLLATVKLGLAPMLVGPAGTGKSTAVEQVARAMKLPFYMSNRVGQAFELTGYTDAQGRYVETPFYRAYKYGGVFLFDEIDGSDPEALVTINTAIAQGYTVFCGERVEMHPNFRLIAAGNTYGTGPDSEYCGRNQLDSATLDRFVVIPWGYDRRLEEKLVGDPGLLEFAWALRDVVEKNHLKIIISTRGILATHKLMQTNAFSLAENLQSNLLEGVEVDTLQTIKTGLKNIAGYNKSNSKYMQALDEMIDAQKSGGRNR